MITKFKVPCDHCGKINEVENDTNIHQVNERLLLMDKKIATLWKILREENESLKGILKEIEAHNKILEGYDVFMVECKKCDFKRKGSLGEILKIRYCLHCKENLELKALVLPPDDATFQEDLR